MYNTLSLSELEKIKSAENALICNVYIWMFGALLTTAITSFSVINSYSLLNILLENSGLFYGVILAEFALVFCISRFINRLSFASAFSLFILYSILNGVSLSLILIAYAPESVATAFLSTAGAFGAMSLYGYTTKKDLSSWDSLLCMSLIGVIIASVVNFFFAASWLYWLITYAGIIIFIGLIAYDTQKIKNMLHGADTNESMQKIALLGALSLYLDFINLFLYILRLFSRK